MGNKESSITKQIKKLPIKLSDYEFDQRSLYFLLKERIFKCYPELEKELIRLYTCQDYGLKEINLNMKFGYDNEMTLRALLSKDCFGNNNKCYDLFSDVLTIPIKYIKEHNVEDPYYNFNFVIILKNKYYVTNKFNSNNELFNYLLKMKREKEILINLILNRNVCKDIKHLIKQYL